MAQFTTHISDEFLNEFLDKFALQHNYQEEIPDPDPEKNGAMIPNPVSKAKFAKNVNKSFLKESFIGGHLKAIEIERQRLIAEAKEKVSGVDVT